MLSCLDRILQCLLFHICFAARKHLSFDFTSRSISKKELVLLHRPAMSAASQKAVHMVGEPGAFPHGLRTYVRIFLVSTPTLYVAATGEKRGCFATFQHAPSTCKNESACDGIFISAPQIICAALADIVTLVKHMNAVSYW